MYFSPDLRKDSLLMKLRWATLGYQYEWNTKVMSLYLSAKNISSKMNPFLTGEHVSPYYWNEYISKLCGFGWMV